MKNIKSVLINCLLVVFASLFIKAGCSKGDDDLPAPPPNSDQYITWKISSHQGYIATPSDSLYLSVLNGSTVLYGGTPFSSSVQSFFYASFNGTSTGSFPINSLDITTGGKEYVTSSNPVQVTINSFGNVGQYVMGSYSGTVKDSTANTTIPISGEFRIKRIQ